MIDLPQIDPTIKSKLDEVLDSLYFNTSFATPTMDQEFIVRLLTKLLVTGVTMWWSLRELWEYLNKRQTLLEGM